MSYWDKVQTGRISRRRALSAAVAAGTSAAILACFGGDEGAETAKKDRSGLLTTRKDTTSSAKPGGIWSTHIANDYVTFDPLTRIGVNVGVAMMGYSTIVSYKPGTRIGNISLEGEAAESWEVSNDGTQVTFKLRPNVKLDPRPPTNGRTLTAEDWIYSWDMYLAKGTNAGDLFTKKSPNLPIESWRATDARTVVFKLAFPYVPFLPLLNLTRYWLVLVPVEHDGKYDANIETRGSGPFMLTSLVQSSKVEWRRNPGYWDAPRPYLDGIDMAVLPDYSTRASQFQAGNLWDADIRAEDILNMKRQVPTIDVWKDDTMAENGWSLALNLRENSPFQDVRVRRGLSMLIDRELLLRTFRNVEAFAREGIDISYRLHTGMVSAADQTYWVDPLGNGLGAGAENLRYNPGEAAKLLNAAGIKNLALPFHVNRAASPEAEAYMGMLNAGGFFRFTVDAIEPTTYARTILQPRGDIAGVAPQHNGAFLDPDLSLTRFYHSSIYSMFPKPLPYEDLFFKQQREFDIEKRKAIWKEIQIKWAETVFSLTGVTTGVSDKLETAQPWFGNRAGITTPAGTTPHDVTLNKRYWFDASKKTS